MCSHLFLPRCHRPSPRGVGSASRIYSANNDFSRRDFRGCRYSVMFRPPSLLAPRIVPTAATTPAGQLGLLHPGTSCFVASTRSGYANRPNTGNWRYGGLAPRWTLSLVGCSHHMLTYYVRHGTCYRHRGLRSSTGPRTHRASSCYIQGMSLAARPESTGERPEIPNILSSCCADIPRRSEAKPR